MSQAGNQHEADSSAATCDSMFTSNRIVGRTRPLPAVQTGLLIAVGARLDAVEGACRVLIC
jgi:hypothetical protein